MYLMLFIKTVVRVPAKVLKVIFPKTQSSQNNGDVIIIDDNSDSGEYSKR